MVRRAISAVFLAALLALSPVAARGDEAVPESPVRRFESVFFITLPFASLYSGIVMIGVSAALQKGKVNFTMPYQVATVVLASVLAGYSAWRDMSMGGPSLQGIALGAEGELLASSRPCFSGSFRGSAGFLETGALIQPNRYCY